MATRPRPPKRDTPCPPGKTGYDVGYAKPPEHTRFQPGRSGNPRGRPKGSKNMRPILHGERMQAIILQEAYRTIKVQDAGRPVTLSMAEAILRSVALGALKGQQRSQRLFTELLRETEAAKKELYDEYLKTMVDYKFSGELEIERCTRLGIEPPEMLPHPDDIILDFANNTVRIVGPTTKESKLVWDKFREKKKEWTEEAAEVEAMLADPANDHLREFLLGELAHAKRILGIISKLIKD